MLPLQPGDVPDTYADINTVLTEIDYRPNTTIHHGIQNFVNWYRTTWRLIEMTEFRFRCRMVTALRPAFAPLKCNIRRG